jgi:hypothetical protein
MNKKFKYIFYIALMFCMLALFSEQKVDAFSLDTSGLYDGNFEFGNGDMYDASGDMQFGNNAPKEEDFWNSIYDKYGQGLIIFSGFVSLIFVIFFIINITKFATAAGNPQTRKQAMQTIMWTGIAAAIFGGIALIVGISSTLFK